MVEKQPSPRSRYSSLSSAIASGAAKPAVIIARSREMASSASAFAPAPVPIPSHSSTYCSGPT